MNEPSNSVVTRDVEDLVNRGCVRSTGLMKWVNKPDTPDPCALTLSDLSQVKELILITLTSNKMKPWRVESNRILIRPISVSGRD